jgi:hypothetical protein
MSQILHAFSQDVGDYKIELSDYVIESAIAIDAALAPLWHQFGENIDSMSVSFDTDAVDTYKNTLVFLIMGNGLLEIGTYNHEFSPERILIDGGYEYVALKIENGKLWPVRLYE